MNQINVAIVVNAINVVFLVAKLEKKLKYFLFQCNIYNAMIFI